MDENITISKKELKKLIDSAVAEAIKEKEIKEEEAPPKEDKSIAYMEELVPIKLFKDNDQYKNDLVLGINGQKLQIKRGVEVKIPRKFAVLIEEIEARKNAAAEADEKARQQYEDMLTKFK